MQTEKEVLTAQEAMEVLDKSLWSFFDVGNFGFSEFDSEDVNSITLQKISLYNELYPDCYLGKVNLYDNDRGQKSAILCKYVTGQRVYNFSYSFMIPCYDAELVKMIYDRDVAEYTGTKADYIRVDAIHARVEKLGGMQLIWV